MVGAGVALFVAAGTEEAALDVGLEAALVEIGRHFGSLIRAGTGPSPAAYPDWVTLESEVELYIHF